MEKIQEIFDLYDQLLKIDIWYLDGGRLYPLKGHSPQNIEGAISRYKNNVNKLNELLDEVEKLKSAYNI